MGIVFAAIATRHRFAKFDGAHRLGAAIWLTAAVCLLQFTGMTAVTIQPDPALMIPTQAIPPLALAVTVTAVTLLILSLGLIGAILDEHLASRAREEAARLRSSETRFRQLTEATFEGILIHVNGRIVDANAAMAQLIGRPVSALVGHDVADFVAESSRLTLRKHMAATASSPARSNSRAPTARASRPRC